MDFLPAGLGFTSGPLFARQKALYYGTTLAGGAIWYVDSNGGIDGAVGSVANPSGGVEPEQPLATLAQAVTNVNTAAAEGALIVIAENHAEDSAAGIPIPTVAVYILGLGAGLTKPRLRLTGAATLLSFVVPARVENLQIAPSTAASNALLAITAAADGSQVINCDFTFGQNDVIEGLANACDSVRIAGCTFTAAGTNTVLQPSLAIASAPTAEFTIEDCTFSGGTYGWSDPYCVNLAACAGLWLNNLIGDAFCDISLVQAASYGFINGMDRWKGRIRIA